MTILYQNTKSILISFFEYVFNRQNNVDMRKTKTS